MATSKQKTIPNSGNQQTVATSKRKTVANSGNEQTVNIGNPQMAYSGNQKTVSTSNKKTTETMCIPEIVGTRSN